MIPVPLPARQTTALSERPALDLLEARMLLASFTCPTGEHDWCTSRATHKRPHLVLVQS